MKPPRSAFWLWPDWDGAAPFWTRDPLVPMRGELDDLDLIEQLWTLAGGKAEITRRHLEGRGYIVTDYGVASPIT